jgi:hypothetical protein
MSVDFDLFPLYDPIIKNKQDLLSDIWVGSLSTMMDTLISYIGQYGFKLPNLTTTQVNQIQLPVNGQLIYNTTVDAPQFYQSSSSSWRTITFT